MDGMPEMQEHFPAMALDGHGTPEMLEHLPAMATLLPTLYGRCAAGSKTN